MSEHLILVAGEPAQRVDRRVIACNYTEGTNRTPAAVTTA